MTGSRLWAVLAASLVVFALGAGVAGVDATGGPTGATADTGAGLTSGDSTRQHVVEGSDTGATATGSASLNRSRYTEQRGDVVTIGISLSNTPNATLTLGNATRNNWVQNVTVEDGDGDGRVVLEFNTYTAGTSDDTYGNGTPYVVYSTVDPDDAVTNVGPSGGAFQTATPAEQTLGDGDYPLAVVAGGTPAGTTDGGADDAATLTLADATASAVRTYVAPNSKEAALDSPAAVSTLLASDNLTRASEIATEDLSVARIDASGLEGILKNHTDSAYANETRAFFAEAGENGLGGGATSAWQFYVNETNPGPDADAYSATLNATNTRLIADSGSDSYWLVIDTAEVSAFTAGDQLETNFTVQQQDDVYQDDTSILATWQFAAATATVDVNADIDDDGNIDEIVVQKATQQEISGFTNVAPGTELSLVLTSGVDASPFVKPGTAFVRPDATWRETFDFSESEAGANFTVDVERGSTRIIPEKVDGRIEEAPNGSLTFADQESFGRTVTVSSVSLSEGGFVRITLYNVSGKPIGNSSYLPAGSSSGVDITLSEPIDEDSRLVATAHLDTDGDQIYEFQYGSEVDRPYQENGGPVYDPAQISVVSPNSAPTATNDSYATPEDTTLSVSRPGVLGNDSDPDGDTLNATVVTGPSNGSLSLSADGSFEYDPARNFDGTDSFTYRASDGSLNDTATVTIDVTAVNDAPVARNDSYATPEDTPLSVSAPGVLGNDSDREGDDLSVSVVSEPANGTLALSSDGSFEYDPAQDFSGTDSFTYAASDGSLTDTATVTIDVTPVNDAPVARNDSYATAEDTTLTVPAAGVLANDSDPDGDTLNATVVAGPSNGTLALSADGSFEYDPAPDFYGTDSFTYRASDGSAGDTATVTLRVDERVANLSARIDTTSAPVLEGETLNVTATLTNVGNDTGTRTVTLTDAGGATVDSRTVTLSPGRSRTVVLGWSTAAGDAGSGTVTVASGDDTATRTVTILEPPTLSLTVDDTTSPVLQGETLVVDAALRNTGDVSTTRTLTLLIDGVRTDRQTVTVSGESVTSVGLEWVAPDGVTGNRTATVTAGSVSATTRVSVDCLDPEELSRSHPPEAGCDGPRDDSRGDQDDGSDDREGSR